MSDEQATKKETPTLEMRLAAIEDKLARLTVTEEELAAYTKVSALSGSRGAAAPSTALSPRVCVSPVSILTNCWVYVHPVVVNDCIQFQAGVASSGAGFGRLGGG
jgi:hypothetical protein